MHGWQLRGVAPSTDRWGLPGLFGRWLTLGVVLVILVLGGVVSVLLYHQADENASAAGEGPRHSRRRARW